MEFFESSYKSLKISKGFWRLSTRDSKIFGAFCVCVQRLSKSSEACACHVGVRRCPCPLPRIYTHAQTFSEGFGVSTSLPHRL